MIKFNDAGLAIIKKWESFAPLPYQGKGDRPGLFTIGYGTIRYPNGKMVTLEDPAITEAQASEYLMLHVKSILPTIDAYLRDDLTDNQFSALISFAYNVGEGQAGLRGSTLLKLVNANPNDENIKYEFAKWVHGEGGKVLPGLVSRRQDECELYFKK